MFSQTAEYALRVVMFLATRREPATTRQIAAVTRVPEGYLSKILQSLARGGIVESQRGVYGGSMLLPDPAQLSVFDVIETVAPLPRIRTCPLGLQAHGTNLCPLHRRLDNAMAMVEEAFRQSTIAELMAEPTESRPLDHVSDSPEAATRIAELVFPVEQPTKLTVSPRRRTPPAKE